MGTGTGTVELIEPPAAGNETANMGITLGSPPATLPVRNLPPGKGRPVGTGRWYFYAYVEVSGRRGERRNGTAVVQEHPLIVLARMNKRAEGQSASFPPDEFILTWWRELNPDDLIALGAAVNAGAGPEYQYLA